MTAASDLYPSLDRRQLPREARAGRLRHTTSGYDLWDRRGAVKPVRVNSHADELAAAGWLELHDDGLWRPTDLGLTHITERTTR